MPIYEFTCRNCQHRFETLVRGADAPSCPQCGTGELDRHFPVPVVQSETTRDLSARAARQRDKAQATERVNEQIRYERSHND